MTHKELKFENLFKKALSEWPNELNLNLGSQVLTEICPTDKGYDLYRYKDIPWDGNCKKYVVKNLYEICEKIEDPYLDTKEEVIWRHVHTAIHRIIRKLSLYTTHVALKNLRREIVHQEFETELKRILKDHDWRSQDIELIKQYFEANPSKSESNGDSPASKS